MKTKTNFKIVVLEDDDFYNRILSRYLSRNLQDLGIIKGFTIKICSYTSHTDCLRNLEPDVDLLFTDYYLNDGYSAPIIMDKLKQRGIDCKVVVMSRLQTIQTAISPIFDGAADFVKKNKDALKTCLYLSESILLEKLKRVN